MDKIYLEDVFKTSGIPTYTFIRPDEYHKLLVAIRTKGRGLVVEGPSGIGKTTSIKKAIEEVLSGHIVTYYSARDKAHLEIISMLPEFKDMGIVIIDDFHKLDDDVKQSLSDFMKLLADEESENSKLVLIGINKAGDSIVSFSPDLNNRIDTIRFEANSQEKIFELIELGERALGVQINIKDEIVDESRGSFHIAQMLCKETCIRAGIIDNKSGFTETNCSFETVKAGVLNDLERSFYPKAKAFAVGSRIRTEGRAPYLHLLNWLANSPEWSIQINDILTKYPEMKLGIKQVVDKGFLRKAIDNNSEIQDVIHFDSESNILTVEDPKFLFYIRNILWNKFAEKIGFSNVKFSKPYDFALSFAGENRDLAEKIHDLLVEREITVFYDRSEQHRILASNVEDYLAPIYKSEAEYVIALLSSSYPQKIWTKFESEQFKDRFGEGKVIPIWFSDSPPGIFDESRKYGGITFEVHKNLEDQADMIVRTLAKKLQENRS